MILVKKGKYYLTYMQSHGCHRLTLFELLQSVGFRRKCSPSEDVFCQRKCDRQVNGTFPRWIMKYSLAKTPSPDLEATNSVDSGMLNGPKRKKICFKFSKNIPIYSMHVCGKCINIKANNDKRFSRLFTGITQKKSWSWEAFPEPKPRVA